LSHTSTSFSRFEEIHSTAELVTVLQSVFTWWLYWNCTTINERTKKKYDIIKWRRRCLRITVYDHSIATKRDQRLIIISLSIVKHLGDRVYKAAAAAVIDGYTGAAAARRLGAGVARAGIDVYRIKTYGQQVEDQHVWYLSRRFIWIRTRTCEYYWWLCVQRVHRVTII